jgi:ligand-binding sensor domain-containing protein/AraC-like DNA-binding protein
VKRKKAFTMKIVLFILLFSNILFTSNGQNNGYFRTVSVEDGLSNNFIRKIYKDSHGFIWAGTLNGLERFDGISFKSYIKPNELKGDVYDVIETDPAFLWVATSQGLWQLNHENEQFVKAGIPDDCRVFCLYKDDGERLLAGTSSGLFVLSGDSITHIPLAGDSGLYDATVRGICFDDADKCWLATSSGLFFCDYSRRGDTKTVRYGYDKTNYFTAIQKTGPQIYLGTNGEGLVKFDVLTKQFSEYINVGNNNILFLTGDNKDNLWVGTDGAGLKKISISKNAVTESYMHNSQDTYSIGSNAVYSFLEDTGNDLLWIGAYSTGLSYRINKRFHTYAYNGFSTRNHHVRSLLIKDGKRLIGTRDGFIYIDEKTHTVKKFNAGEGNNFLKSNIIIKIFPAGKNFLLGTLNGLCVFDPERLSVREFNRDPLFNSGGFYDFTADGHHIWMATFKGVIKVSPNGEFTRYSTENSSLIENLVHSILKDSRGRIWVGTKKGVCYFDAASATFKRAGIFPSSIYDCKITHIYEDRNSCLWFCTETDGLYRINRELTLYEHYTAGERLPDNAVTGIMEDEQGYFWVATHKGLARCTFTDNSPSFYWISDGLPGLMFNPGACYYEHENRRLWWGNENGLVFCNMEQVNKNIPAPPVHITGFYVNGKRTPPAADPLVRANGRNVVRLSRFQNSFGFDFVALNYLYPNDNRFNVALDGYDKDWVLLDKGCTSAYYGDIPPGKYTFRVHLSGYPESEKQITVIVKQAWITFLWIIPLFALCFACIRQWKKLRVFKRKKGVIKRKTRQEESPSKDYSSQRRTLLQLMEEKKPYLDPELKMSYLTAELKCTPKELSMIFKESIQKSFTDFINEYRVEEFKNKIRNCEFKKYTIATLSEQCGFNSRSSFFRIFKKITGATPFEYMKQMKDKNSAHIQ